MFRSLRKIRLSLPMFLVGFFYLYLGFHALSGNQGLLQWRQYHDQIQTLEDQSTALQMEYAALKRRAVQLQSQHLDLDRLEEDAIQTLNISHVKDIAIDLDE